MNSADDATRQQLIHQVLRARSLPAIDEASHALTQWMQEHPEDQGMRDGFEALAMMQEIQEWRLANPAEWAAEQEAERRAIALHQPERDRMLGRARSARTPTHLDRAERELFQWAADHPEDVGRELGILEALTDVLDRREALEAQDKTALVGQAA